MRKQGGKMEGNNTGFRLFPNYSQNKPGQFCVCLYIALSLACMYMLIIKTEEGKLMRSSFKNNIDVVAKLTLVVETKFVPRVRCNTGPRTTARRYHGRVLELRPISFEPQINIMTFE